MQNLAGQQWEEEEWTFYLKRKKIAPVSKHGTYVLKAAVFLLFWSLSVRRRQFGNVFGRSEYSGSSWTTFLYIYSTDWMDLLSVCRCAVSVLLVFFPTSDQCKPFQKPDSSFVYFLKKEEKHTAFIFFCTYFSFNCKIWNHSCLFFFCCFIYFIFFCFK